MKGRLRAPSPALVISLIALFVALGGTTYAATSLPKNSVGTKQLKNNAVTGVKIKAGAVTAAKINTSGLTVPNATHATNADHATTATSVAALTWTNLTLENGWTGQCFDGGTPQISKSSEGIVYLRGVICTTASNPVAFNLPTGFAPSKTQWLPADECNGTTGRIDIMSSGVVVVDPAPGISYANSAGCFTSLSGAEYTLP